MSVISPDDPLLVPDDVASLTSDEVRAADRIDTPLKVVIATSFLLRLAGAATALLLAAYLREVVDAKQGLIGLLAAVFYVTELTLAPVFGALSDLRGRKLILVLGPLLGALAVPIYPFTTFGVFLALGRMLEGLSTAAKVPSALGYLADATTGTGPRAAALRGRVMGLYEISFVVGLVAGNVLGGQLWDKIGTAGFWFVSAIYLLAAVLLMFFVPESLPAEAREHHTQSKMAAQDAGHPVRALLRTRLHSYGELLKEPALRSFIPAWLAINAVVGLWSVHIQPLMIRTANPRLADAGLLDGNFSTSQVGFAFGAFGLMFMIGIYVWSLFYARIRKTNMMLAAIAGLFLVCLAMLGINNGLLSLPAPYEQWHWAPVLAFGVLLVSGFTPVALAYLAEISGTRIEHRGAVMGLYSVFLGIGQLLGGAGGGFFLEATGLGFNGVILGTAALGVVAAVTVMWLRTRHNV